MKTIFVPCPSAWDTLQLGGGAFSRKSEYRILFDGKSAADHPAEIRYNRDDVLRNYEEARQQLGYALEACA